MKLRKLKVLRGYLFSFMAGAVVVALSLPVFASIVTTGVLLTIIAFSEYNAKKEGEKKTASRQA